jgi:choline kinase
VKRAADITLVILAAGLSTRYGKPKQLVGVGQSGEALMDYCIYDAWRAGFSRVLLVVRREIEQSVREHLEPRFGRAVTLSFAYQELTDLPPGYAVPPSRRKPWGTGHALLVAARAVAEPFAACNADDYYGPSSFMQLREHLLAARGDAPAYALIGYRLADTLSVTGGVSRGICQVDGAGFLRGVTEVKDIRRQGDRVVGTTLDGASCSLTGEEITSTGLFGLTPAVTATLERKFAEFLTENGSDPEAEFLIGMALNEEIASGRVRIRLIPTDEPWIGITHAEDREMAVRRIAELVAAGRYPADLTSALSPDTTI